MKKISVIVPCFNEEDVIDVFYDKLTSFWGEALGQYELEPVFIDDGSTDRTADRIHGILDKDSTVRYGSFTRNFGKEAAILAGLKLCTGDCAIVMDADLQHPVEVIPDMVSAWENGYEIVEGIKSSRGKEPGDHSILAAVFYRLISSQTGFDMRNSSDFKLLDRKVVDVLGTFTEQETFFRALSFWTGFKSTSVEFAVQKRAAGKSKWRSSSLVKYAFRNLIEFTYAPLYLIMILGVIVMLIGAWLGIDAVITYFEGKAVGGYPSLVILITLSTGAILLSLGIIAVYLSKVFNEVKNRPRYIFREHN